MNAEKAIEILTIIKAEENLSEIRMSSLNYIENSLMQMAEYLNHDIRLNIKHKGSFDYMKYDIIDYFANLK